MRQRLSLSVEEAKSLYLKAMGEHATEVHDADWWITAKAEIEMVVNAETPKDGAPVVTGWRNDWVARQDSPVRAARRLMRAAFRNV